LKHAEQPVERLTDGAQQLLSGNGLTASKFFLNAELQLRIMDLFPWFMVLPGYLGEELFQISMW
jgi:hypothetical protein